MQYDENAEKYGYEGEMVLLKCDELKSYGMADPAIGDEYEMYKVAEVDAAIVELKDTCRYWHKCSTALKIKLSEKDEEITELKQEIERLKKENEMTFVGVNIRSPVSDGRFV